MTTNQKQTVGVAIASLVLGILGLILIGPLGSIPAVICGHIALSRIKKNPDALAGDGLALTGLILGYIQIGFMLLILPLLAAIAIPAVVKAKENAQRYSCFSNLHQIEFAKEKWASQTNQKDHAGVDTNAISRFLANGTVPRCPAGGRAWCSPCSASSPQSS